MFERGYYSLSWPMAPHPIPATSWHRLGSLGGIELGDGGMGAIVGEGRMGMN